MGFSDAIYWSLLPEWVQWVTVGEDGRCHGFEGEPEYSKQLGRWTVSDPMHAWITIPQKDVRLAGVWKRPDTVGQEFVLVDDEEVGAKLKKEFLEFLTDRDIRLTKAQHKLGDVILEAAAGDTTIQGLLTQPNVKLALLLYALGEFGKSRF